MYRFQKFAKKHKPALATAAAIALCLLLGTTVSAWQAVRATTAEAQANANEQKAIANEQQAVTNAAQAQEKTKEATEQRDEAQKQRDEVKALNEQLRRTLYASNINLAQTAWDAGNVGRVHELLDQLRPKPGESDLRRFEWHYLNRLCHSGLLTLKEHSNELYTPHSVAYSPDGKRLASASSNNTVKVYDAQSGRELLSLKGGGGFAVAFSPDGKRLAFGSGTWDTTKNAFVAIELKVCDAQSGQELLAFKGHTMQVKGVAFSQDGKRLASTSGDWTRMPKPAEVKVWDVETSRELLSLPGLTGEVLSVAFSAEGNRLASTSRRDGNVKVWDVISGQELLSLKGNIVDSNGDTTGIMASVAFSPDGKRLASGNKVWDAETGKPLLSLTEGSQIMAFSSDGTRLACAERRKEAKLRDAQSGRELLTFKGHIGGITSVVISSDGTRLASGSRDGNIKVWNATYKIGGNNGNNIVSSVSFSRDGKRLAYGIGSEMKVWDTQSGQEVLVCEGRNESVRSVAYSPDGNRLASASGKTVKVWDAQTGREILAFKGHTAAVVSVVYSPDGMRVASCSNVPNGFGFTSDPGEPGEVKVWNARSGEELLTLKGHRRFVNCVTFSPDGKRLATLSRDQTVKVWDAQTGQEIRTFEAIAFGGGSVAFSPDGIRLASSHSGQVKVRNIQTGEELLTLKGQSGMIQTVAFSPDGERLVTGSGSPGPGGEIKVWDALTGKELLTLEGNVGPPNGLAFSPDGHRLAGGRRPGLNGSVKIWDATPLPEKP